MLRTLKYFFLLGILILLTLCALNLAGTVTIRVADYHLQTSLPIFMTVCLIVFLILYFIIRGYQNIRGIPLFIEGYFQKRSSKLGIEYLQKTIALLEAQDYTGMMRSAQQVEKFLPNKMLGLYYKCVAAQNMGDFKHREAYLKDLMQTEEGGFVAAKLLSELYVKKNQIQEGIQWAKRAYEMDRKSPWPLKQLLNLTVVVGDYEEAQKYLKQLHTLRQITPDFYNHAQAVLLYEKGKLLKSHERIKLLEKSTRLDSHFIPAVSLLIKEYLNEGKKSRAQLLIEKTWTASPHPSLIPFYISIFEDSDVDEIMKAKHLQRLVSFNDKSPIGLMEAAKIFMKAHLWGQANDYINRIPDSQRTQEVLKLMADLEIKEKGNHEKAEEILSHLPQAPLDKSYECESCGSTTPKWKINCPSCGNFGRLKY